MPSSKYERELRFINNEVVRLTAELDDLREMMPQNPLDAEKKAVDVGLIEERLGELMMRKNDIEDSFIAAGMEIPDLRRSMNLNTCRDTANYSDEEPVRQEMSVPVPEVRPAAGLDELSAQVASITDELMQIEIKMLQAEISDDESEKAKLTMSANALRDRRDNLVRQIKELKSAPAENDDVSDDALVSRIAALEADNRALRSQLSAVRSDITAMMDDVRRIMAALNLDTEDQ